MPTPLKDLYSPEFVARLADAVGAQLPGFLRKRFVADALDEAWPRRELKARMRHLSECLGRALPADYPAALGVLDAVAPQFSGLTGMLFPDFLEVHGRHDWEASLPALRAWTRYSSSEFAVRPFLLEDQGRMLAVMRRWADDPDEHVRRLASEGSRPRLPWACDLPALKADPAPLLPILEALRADPSEYVRRSVANSLNDVAKDHPDVTLRVAERWLGTHPATDRLVKHACRTLLKRSDPRALRLFGFAASADVALRGLTVSPDPLAVGEDLVVRFELTCTTSRLARVDLAVDYATARGGLTRKVMKISERTLGAGTHTIQRRQSFADRSTRTHRVGTHRVTVLVNGVELASHAFEVTRPDA